MGGVNKLIFIICLLGTHQLLLHTTFYQNQQLGAMKSVIGGENLRPCWLDHVHQGRQDELPTSTPWESSSIAKNKENLCFHTLSHASLEMNTTDHSSRDSSPPSPEQSTFSAFLDKRGERTGVNRRRQNLQDRLRTNLQVVDRRLREVQHLGRVLVVPPDAQP